MEVYLPFYHRPPNKFLRYEERPFSLGVLYGHTKETTGVERVAIFLNKKGQLEEMTAQVIWDEN